MGLIGLYFSTFSFDTERPCTNDPQIGRGARVWICSRGRGHSVIRAFSIVLYDINTLCSSTLITPSQVSESAISKYET